MWYFVLGGVCELFLRNNIMIVVDKNIDIESAKQEEHCFLFCIY